MPKLHILKSRQANRWSLKAFQSLRWSYISCIVQKKRSVVKSQAVSDKRTLNLGSLADRPLHQASCLPRTQDWYMSNREGRGHLCHSWAAAALCRNREWSPLAVRLLSLHDRAATTPLLASTGCAECFIHQQRPWPEHPGPHGAAHS